jgi:hypothetical protein
MRCFSKSIDISTFAVECSRKSVKPKSLYNFSTARSTVGGLSILASTPLLAGHQSSAQVGRPEFFKRPLFNLPLFPLFSYFIPLNIILIHSKCPPTRNRRMCFKINLPIPVLLQLPLPLVVGQANQLL